MVYMHNEKTSVGKNKRKNEEDGRDVGASPMSNEQDGAGGEIQAAAAVCWRS